MRLLATRGLFGAGVLANLLAAMPIAGASPPAPSGGPSIAVSVSLDEHDADRARGREFAEPGESFVGNAEPSESSYVALPSPSVALEPESAITTPRLATWALELPSSASRTKAFRSRLDAPTLRGRLGIGRTWHFVGGRRLSMDLTPTPRHCAPLIALTF